MNRRGISQTPWAFTGHPQTIGRIAMRLFTGPSSCDRGLVGSSSGCNAQLGTRVPRVRRARQNVVGDRPFSCGDTQNFVASPLRIVGFCNTYYSLIHFPELPVQSKIRGLGGIKIRRESVDTCSLTDSCTCFLRCAAPLAVVAVFVCTISNAPTG